ncbi:MarR family transcriptional regulator [Salinigranum marinum]|uniref:MarR family transcriptional regulator n=1 Tax=Salinigranum marinum TaxID=1515595 RepID=UPI002989D26C|nr:MarR family transcriptional regulator [Salinigranum marinum]
MVLLDDRILELLEEEENEYMAPSDIAEDDRIHYSSNHVGRRCKKLAEHGLLLSVGRGVYTITDDGRAYLRGEYNAAEQNDVEVSEESNNSEAEGKDGA